MGRATMRNGILKRIILLASFFAVAGVCLAQTDTARLQGTITDPSGAAVTGATITVTNSDTGRMVTVQPNADGFYVAPALPAGRYHVVVEKSGFQKAVQDFELQVSQIAVVDFKLQVGQVSQTVTVEGGSPVIDSADSSIGTVIEGRQVTELPLNGRNFTELATIEPGVNRGIPTGSATGTQNNTETFRYKESGGASLAVNGLPPEANNFIFDGIDNNESLVNTITFFTPADALQEFKVITNVAPAEYGRAGGAVLVSSLNSGSNEFHGSAFWFHRDESLDSEYYFPSSEGVFARNQFGGTVGGPIIKNKLFFFGDYQGLREHSPGPSGIGTVPTDKMRSGDFSELLNMPANNGLYPVGTSIYIADPTTGLPCNAGNQTGCFGGNMIPSGRVNSVGQNYLKAFPEPNCTSPAVQLGCGSIINNYRNSEVLDETWNDFDVRVDYNFNSANQFFGRFSRGDANNTETPFLTTLPSGFGTGTTFNHPNGASLGWTHIFNQNVINEMHYGYVRTNYGYVPPFDGTALCTQLGIPNCNNSSELGGIALIGGYNTQIEYTGDYGPYLVPQTGFDWNDSLSWVKGNHTLKFGANLIRRQLNLYRPLEGKGYFDLCGNGGSGSATGYEVSDLLAGFVCSYGDGVPYGMIGTRSWENGFFAQDDWRVTNRLTLNLGMRWEVFTQPVEVDDRQANFDVATGALILAGSGGSSRSLVPTDYHNFEPRAGFAYQLTGDGKTVIRGGVGIFHFLDRGGISNQLGQNPPFSGDATFNQTSGYEIALSGALPCSPACTSPAQLDSTTATAPVPTGAAAFANLNYSNPANVSVIGWLPSNLTPMVTEWNLQVQRQIATNTSISIGYVGDHGAHLPGYYNSNDYQFGMDTNLPGSRLFPILAGSVDTYNTYGKSNFHSLQAQFDRRFMKGLQFTASFTWEKQTDDTCGAYDCSGPTNFRNLGLEEGLSDLDQPYHLVMSSLYELPIGRGKRWGNNWSRPLDWAIGGWQVNGIYNLQSGMPFDLNVSGGIQAYERPDASGSIGVNPGNLSNYINVSGFTGPPATWYADTNQIVYDRPGTGGRNILIGPGSSNLDFAIFKNFDITERVKASFRVQFYNITNTPHFGQPNTSVGNYSAPGGGVNAPAVFNPNSEFGEITTVLPYSNREGELGLRITF
jgi:hypothetical protein